MMAPAGALLLDPETVRFERDPEDQVRMRRDGETRTVSTVSMAFPLSNPKRMVVVRDESGSEVAMLDDLRQLDADSRRVIKEELEKSYFMPQILDVERIEEELNVVTWKVLTDRGRRTFQVRAARTNIRKLAGRRLIIRDVDGNRFLIGDWFDLPPRARRLVEEHV